MSFCHKHGHSQFHLHQRKAESSDPFLWAEGVPGVEMHSDVSAVWEQCHVTTDRLLMEREVQKWSHKR